MNKNTDILKKMRLVKHFFIGFVVGYTAIITLQLLLQAI